MATTLGCRLLLTQNAIVPLSTEGDPTVRYHTMAFQLQPSDAVTGLTVSAIMASLDNVRIAQRAARRAQAEPDSISNKVKSFADKTELSKSTIVLVDSNTTSHETNSQHVLRESTPKHPMGLLSSPGLTMGEAAALASTLPNNAASFVLTLVSEEHRKWLHNVPERGTSGAQFAREKYVTTRVNAIAQVCATRTLGMLLSSSTTRWSSHLLRNCPTLACSTRLFRWRAYRCAVVLLICRRCGLASGRTVRRSNFYLMLTRV